MNEHMRNSLLHAAVVACAVLLPVFILCHILSSFRLAFFCILPPYLAFSVLLWRFASANHITEKLPRLTLLLAGAAGIIAPVMMYQAQAYGLGGVWYILLASLMSHAAYKLRCDRIAFSAASACAVFCLPGAATGVLQAVCSMV